MDDRHSSIESLAEKAETFSKTSIELYKLKLIDKTSDWFSSLVARIAVIVAVLVFTALLSIGVSLWVGELFEKGYYGFFIVAAFYALVSIVLYFFRDRWIKEPVSNSFIKSAMN